MAAGRTGLLAGQTGLLTGCYEHKGEATGDDAAGFEVGGAAFGHLLVADLRELGSCLRLQVPAGRDLERRRHHRITRQPLDRLQPAFGLELRAADPHRMGPGSRPRRDDRP